MTINEQMTKDLAVIECIKNRKSKRVLQKQLLKKYARLATALTGIVYFTDGSQGTLTFEK